MAPEGAPLDATRCRVHRWFYFAVPRCPDSTKVVNVQFEDALELMACGGYCLWVGAGVAIHLGRGYSPAPLDWASFVGSMEAKSKNGPPPPQATLPERVEACLREFGREEFQKMVRAAVVVPLAKNIVQAARAHHGDASPVPPAARQLVKLGAFANPIVSFNIETYTSRLIGGAWPHQILAFNPARVGPTRAPSPGRVTTGRRAAQFYRSIYHPHGAIDEHGLCVLAESEYRGLRGSLALQLATHAAFGTRLAIVGMSLEDAYLREQIAVFRNEMQEVLWFQVGQPQPEAAHWAWAHAVTCINVGDWPHFWTAIDREFVIKDENERDVTDRKCLHAWVITLLDAYRMSLGVSMHVARRKVLAALGAPHSVLLSTDQGLADAGLTPDDPTELDHVQSEEFGRLIAPISRALGWPGSSVPE